MERNMMWYNTVYLTLQTLSFNVYLFYENQFRFLQLESHHKSSISHPSLIYIIFHSSFDYINISVYNLGAMKNHNIMIQWFKGIINQSQQIPSSFYHSLIWNTVWSIIFITNIFRLIPGKGPRSSAWNEPLSHEHVV